MNIQQNTTATINEINRVASNILNISKDTMIVGENIMHKLEQDDRKIDKMIIDLGEINVTLEEGNRRVNSINSVFGTIKNKLTKNNVKNKNEGKLKKINDDAQQKITPYYHHSNPTIDNGNGIEPSTSIILDNISNVLDDMIVLAKDMGDTVNKQNKKLDMVTTDLANINPKVNRLTQKIKHVA
jgi:hypothetical protein